MVSIAPKHVLMILTSIVLGSFGQISLKHGMATSHIKLSGDVIDKIQALIIVIFTRPYVTVGFALYGASALLWLVILKNVQLSFAYPMIALSYVLVTFLSWLIFREHVNWISVTGLFFICCGVALVGVGLGRTAAQ